MTHSWESTFRRHLTAYLIDNGYRVRSNVYLSESERYVDLVADDGVVVLAIETENDFEAAFKGVSQAAVYAEGIEAEYPSQPVFAVVALPAGHVEEPEREQIEHRTGTPIWAIDPSP